MPVHAITDNYQGQVLDAKANFGGNIVVYFGWDRHLMFCAAKAFPLSPDMRFGDVLANVLPEAFSQHPEFSQINWQTAQWQLDNQPINPQPDQTLAELGADHKSLFRFVTPELKGFRNAGI
ncbi:phenol hydroxylase subunit P4 [Marinobacterium arenosum]|uniref:phenol hydroxylase subunit P4 n=1 Tax=Marinobacterium arenosum TaxID=2862496 RepID=UPI001C97D41E|nr:phenol hydroxylase subunit P4 [Marinobacterium arenosum]MBY4676717.1 phenol hydroxylase subunit P4 [Marinobacterium arenosum]